VIALCSDKVPAPGTGALYEVGSGYQARTRWQRSEGYGFPIDVKLTPEDVVRHWEKIIDFNNGRADYPESGQDALRPVLANIEKRNTKSQVAKL
jgi:multifunctional beta-oxidation protein